MCSSDLRHGAARAANPREAVVGPPVEHHHSRTGLHPGTAGEDRAPETIALVDNAHPARGAQGEERPARQPQHGGRLQGASPGTDAGQDRDRVRLCGGAPAQRVRLVELPAELAVTGGSRQGIAGGKLPETRLRDWLPGRCGLLPLMLFGAKERPLATAKLRIVVARWRTATGLPKMGDRKSTRLNSSHSGESRMPSSA